MGDGGEKGRGDDALRWWSGGAGPVTVDAGLLKDVYVLDYVWSADGLAVAWELVEGELQKAQHGS